MQINLPDLVLELEEQVLCSTCWGSKQKKIREKGKKIKSILCNDCDPTGYITRITPLGEIVLDFIKRNLKV